MIDTQLLISLNNELEKPFSENEMQDISELLNEKGEVSLANYFIQLSNNKNDYNFLYKKLFLNKAIAKNNAFQMDFGFLVQNYWD